MCNIQIVILVNQFEFISQVKLNVIRSYVLRQSENQVDIGCIECVPSSLSVGLEVWFSLFLLLSTSFLQPFIRSCFFSLTDFEASTTRICQTAKNKNNFLLKKFEVKVIGGKVYEEKSVFEISRFSSRCLFLSL